MLYKLLPLPLKVSLDYVMLVNLSARRVTKPLLYILKFFIGIYEHHQWGS